MVITDIITIRWVRKSRTIIIAPLCFFNIYRIYHSDINYVNTYLKSIWKT